MPNTAENFLWGATVSAHAVEGGDFDADWWRFEQRPGRIAMGHTSEVAADHRKRFREDFNLAQKTGLTCLHYGISWARIEPRKGEYQDAALAHYQSVFSEMRNRGINPIAVLNEDALPAWFSDMGAWCHPAALELFGACLARLYDAIGAICRLWLPFSDPMLWQRMTVGERRWPRPAWRYSFGLKGAGCIQRAQKVARDFLIRKDSANRVGLSLAVPALLPSDPHSPWDAHAVQWQLWARRYIADAALAEEDPGSNGVFLVLTVPGRQYVHFSPLQPGRLMAKYEREPEKPGSADAGSPDAAAFSGILARVTEMEMPTLVVGGVATEHDPDRCRYILDHVQPILAARDQGANILGYCHRSLLDGFEGCYGFTRRYGLIHVDRKTLARTPNPSAFLMQDIAKNQEIRPGAVARYCPGWAMSAREAC